MVKLSQRNSGFLFLSQLLLLTLLYYFCLLNRLFLYKKLNKQEALERMKYDNHKYIRRQETYFKKMPKVSFFDPLKAGFDSLMLSLVESG